MKTIKITLEKEGAQATCTHVFRTDDWPMETTWAGNHGAFMMPSGRLIPCLDGIDNLPETVAFQANLCGATFKIEDLGGEVQVWHSRIDFGQS
ncbi:MAG: hypothetical protein WCS43_03550 [Verrucomicrobiota bacterium]